MKPSSEKTNPPVSSNPTRQKIATELLQLLESAAADQRETAAMILKVKADIEQTLGDAGIVEGTSPAETKEMSPDQALKKLKAHLKIRQSAMAGIDLSGENLQGMDLTGLNLEGANLSRCNLWNCRLEKANLRSANMQQCDLDDTHLEEADLTGADLSGSNISMIRTHLAHTILNGAKLEGTPIAKAEDERQQRLREEAEARRNSPCIPPNHW